MAYNKSPKSTTVHKTSSQGRTERPVSATDKPRRNDPSDNKMRGYRYVYEVYPDWWDAWWGPKPLLGYVRADSEFNAKYAAYDKKLLTVNSTFGPEVRKATKFIKDI
jgi:hypothetical protein